MYYSQAGQDKWVYELIGAKGFFVDVGAYDGIQTSNTYALELLGWEGICIEANPEVFKLLVKNRNCRLSNSAVSDMQGIRYFDLDGSGCNMILSCDTLDNILIDFECQKKIDYLSMDIEGYELEALKCFPFETWDISLITIEHNLYLRGPEYKEALFKLLTEKGFTRVVEDVKCLDPNPLYFNQPFEDWYAKNSFMNK